jgi:hypothetical protein
MPIVVTTMDCSLRSNQVSPIIIEVKIYLKKLCTIENELFAQVDPIFYSFYNKGQWIRFIVFTFSLTLA